MDTSPERVRRTLDYVLRAAEISASISMRGSPPERITRHIQTRNPLPARTNTHPLLIPDIMCGVFAHLDDDIQSLAQSIQVCRLWWQEGHQRVWRNVQLRDLYDCLKDLSRRQYFASLVETIVFRPGDTILAEQRLSHQLLAFSRLSSVEIYGSNFEGARTENIMSLIVPSLRSWSVEYGDIQRKGDRETDDIAAMSVLLTGCATLSSLNVQLDCEPSLGPVVYEMLDAITAIEHIHLQLIGEILYDTYPSEDLLQRFLCNKPKLATLSFTHGLDFFQEDIDFFLARVGSDWLVPSLRSFGRPVFNSGPAAVKLINRMPNLEQLALTVMADSGNWGNDLEHLFTFISILPHLEHLELEISGENCDLDGSWLAQLGNLEQLEFLWLRYYNPGVISVTGAQFVPLNIRYRCLVVWYEFRDHSTCPSDLIFITLVCQSPEGSRKQVQTPMSIYTYYRIQDSQKKGYSLGWLNY